MTSNRRPMGMKAFYVIWFGQIISLLGTAMSNFGMTIWAYEQTDQATALALIGFFFVTPMLLILHLEGEWQKWRQQRRSAIRRLSSV